MPAPTLIVRRWGNGVTAYFAELSAIRTLIWCDPVNIFESLAWFLHLSFRGQDQQQPWQVMATIDQADIRGSEPHNHDPSGAAFDYFSDDVDWPDNENRLHGKRYRRMNGRHEVHY
jgi:hypothetical protein